TANRGAVASDSSRPLPPFFTFIGGTSMKSATWIMGLLSVIALSTTAAIAADSSAGGAPPARDRAAMEAVLASQEKAWKTGDFDTFFQGYWKSDEVSYSGSGGVLKGWATVQERFKKKYATPQSRGTLKFSNLEFRSLGP